MREQERFFMQENERTGEVVRLGDDDLQSFPNNAVLPADPEQRFNEICILHGWEEGKTFVYKHVHKKTMRGSSVDAIARELNISVKEVRKAQREIRRLLSKQLASLDTNTFVSETMSYLDEVRELALTACYDEKIKPMQLAALLATVTRSEETKAKMMKDAGLFGLKPMYSAGSQTTAEAEAKELHQMIASAMKGEELQDFNEEEVINI